MFWEPLHHWKYIKYDFLYSLKHVISTSVSNLQHHWCWLRYHSTWLQLTGWCFGFGCGKLLAHFSLFALFRGPLRFLPCSPLCFELCFTLSRLVGRGRWFWGRHRNWCRSRHYWRSWDINEQKDLTTVMLCCSWIVTFTVNSKIYTI